MLDVSKKDIYGKFPEVIDIRFYGTNAATYCCIWIHSKKIYTSGSGRACGWGYNRTSSALEEAIRKAGFIDFPRFGGSGVFDYPIDILCKFLQVKKYQIVEFFA